MTRNGLIIRLSGQISLFMSFTQYETLAVVVRAFSHNSSIINPQRNTLWSFAPDMCSRHRPRTSVLLRTDWDIALLPNMSESAMAFRSLRNQRAAGIENPRFGKPTICNGNLR